MSHISPSTTCITGCLSSRNYFKNDYRVQGDPTCVVEFRHSHMNDTKILTLKALVASLKDKTVKELHEFALKNFGAAIGQGAYRKVWKVELRNRSVVLKIANNEGASWSNGTEMRVFRRCRKLSIISRVYAHDTSKKNRWLVSEYVPHSVQDEGVMTFFNISKLVWERNIYSFSGDVLYRYFESNQEYKENAWFKELKELKEKGEVYDLHYANWRMNNENKPILVDYGCAGVQ